MMIERGRMHREDVNREWGGGTEGRCGDSNVCDGKSRWWTVMVQCCDGDHDAAVMQPCCCSQ